MASVDSIRNSIINKLLTISNKDYLSALYQLVEKSNIDENIVKLSKEQKKLLKLSEEDIKNKDFITQKELDKEDQEWIKGL